MEDRGVQEVLQLLRNDGEVQDYFFQKLAKANDPLRWFSHLVQEGYFEPDRNPAPIELSDKSGYYSMPHWHAIEALGHVIAKCVETSNDELLPVALDTLNLLVVSGTVARGPVYNIRTDWLLVQAIGKMPPGLIDLSYISFAEQAVKNRAGWSLVDGEIGSTLLPKVLQGGKSDCIIALLRVVLGFKAPSSGPRHELESLLNPPDFVACLEKNRQGLWDWNVLEVITMVRAFIREALAVEPFTFRGTWIPAIESHAQTMSPERYDCQMTYLLRDAILQLSVGDGQAVLKELLDSEIVIFRRVAYFVIGERYRDWSVLFWSLDRSPLEEHPYHEVYELLRKNCTMFDAVQLKRCVDWIESLQLSVGEDSELDEGVQQKYRAYMRREWLTALAGSSDPEIVRLTEHYQALNDAPILHPGFSSWTGGVHGVGETSPIPEEDFRALPAAEAVRYLNEFTPPPRSFEEPYTEVSLMGALRRFVANDPDHFLSDLTPYLDADWKYVVELIRGFEEATRSKSLGRWPVVIDFALEAMTRLDRSLDGTVPGPSDHRSWVVGAIADLLSTASDRERDGFPETCSGSTERLVVALMNLPAESFRPTPDVLTSILNTQTGRTALCAVRVSIAMAKRVPEGAPSRWSAVIQQEVSRRLEDRTRDHAELRGVLAFSMNDMFYLDTSWAKDQFHSIYDLQRPEIWQMAFSCLMVSTSVVYQEVFGLLRDGGHFDRALTVDLVGRDVDQKFVQVVVVGYLAGWDDLNEENGILRRLIQRGKTEQLTEVGRFIWSKESRDDGTFREKIVPLWHHLLDHTTQAPSGQDHGGVLSELGSWLKWADTIDDEVFGLMSRSIAGMDTNRFPSFFVEDLAQRAEAQPKEVGQLLWRFLEHRPVPFFKHEVIRAIVESLFRNQEAELATRIFNYYTRHGHPFLRDLIERYQPSSDALL